MYAIIWRFAVKPGLENEFEEAYGPDGVWAEFFRRGDGYLEPELLREVAATGHYVTIDRWESKSAYDNFRTQFAAGYNVIDERCEALTEAESEIGTYEVVVPELPGGNIQDDDES